MRGRGSWYKGSKAYEGESDVDKKTWFGINPVDLGLAVVVVGLAGGYLLAKRGHVGLRHVIKGHGVADVDLLIHGNVEDPSVFKAGEKTFITIRNQPYAPVAIIAAKVTPHMLTFPTPGGARAFPDVADPMDRDILLTIRDKATLTDDGVVFGGSKVKVGVPIEVEGYKYKLTGSIVDVRLENPS